ncbi:MAG: Mitochondrial GTPase [Chaenotheca gracillima]|nr:MAG: Mitochondrial GTPase [Chaenotheca gracillima]
MSTSLNINPGTPARGKLAGPRRPKLTPFAPSHAATAVYVHDVRSYEYVLNNLEPTEPKIGLVGGLAAVAMCIGNF